MNVLHLIQLNPRKIGSFEEFLIDLARRGHADGIKISIAFENEVPYELKQKYKGIELFVLSKRVGRINFYYRLISIICKVRPDAVHISFYSIFSAIPLILYLLGVKRVFVTDHVSGLMMKKPFLGYILVWIRNKILLNFIEKIVCVSYFVLNRDAKIPGMNKAKLTVIYNGINLRRFIEVENKSKARHLLGLDKDKFVIASVANLIDEKGIDYLVEASKSLVPIINNSLFLIVGDGPEKDRLLRFVNKLGVMNNFRFFGLRNDVELILSASDVFVYPSIWEEAFGLAIVEAMGCRIPVIASEVGGIPEIVENYSTGLLVKPKSSIAIAYGIKSLYEDLNLRTKLKANAALKVSQEFDLDRIVDKTIDLYLRRGCYK